MKIMLFYSVIAVAMSTSLMFNGSIHFDYKKPNTYLQYVPDVTYKITKRVDQRGYDNIVFYNLVVTNNTDEDIYVYGTVHIIGSSDYETRHYKGYVVAHRSKSVFETIDEPFSVVKMEYQDVL